MNKRKNTLARILFNPKVLAFLGLAVIVLISFPIAKNASQRHNINKEVRELEEEIKLIGEKNTNLQKLINYLSSDQYVEEHARLNFGLKKQGEQAVVVDTLGGSSAPVGGVNEGHSQNAENANLANDKDGVKLTKSIYNIPGLDKVQPKKPVSNPEKWWKYFFGGG